MQLSDLRTEILAHGFDPIAFSASRLNTYINDGYYFICRRVNYYAQEAQINLQTTAGTSYYPLMPVGAKPIANSAGNLYNDVSAIARVKSVWDPNRNVELEEVQERDIDRSSTASGTPNFYSIGFDGQIRLYPTPDTSQYQLWVRAWTLPPALVNDTDYPSIPQDWHWLLWTYGCWMCYEAEDDPQTAQYWEGRFEKGMAEFAADARFPSSDYPTQLGSIWEQDKELSNNGWALYWGW